jgi:SAM-dependent methyltransferase
MSTTNAEFWPGDRAARWVRVAERLERQLAPVTELLLTTAEVQPGAAVLDVGCGTGPTTRRVARLVGPQGSVMGVDVSPEMIEGARRVGAASPDAPPIEWVEADVVTWDAGDVQFDTVISQFGVMFFGDPRAAFTNLAWMTRPGGHLHVAVWADRRRVQAFDLPLSVALDELGRAGVDVEVPAADVGPFSLSDPVHVEQLLGAAGWSDVRWEPHALKLAMGGGAGPAEAAGMSLEFGQVRLVIADVGEEIQRRVRVALERAFAEHVENGAVMLEAAFGIVTARCSSTA